MTASQFQGQDPNAITTWTDQVTMYAHTLNQVFGTFGSEYQVAWSAAVYADDADGLYAGMTCYLHPETCVFHKGASSGCLPFFAKPAGGYAGVASTGNVFGNGILAVPCIPSQVWQSSEYKANNELEPNAPLRANSSGKLEIATYYHDDICGVVLEAPANLDGKDVLTFLSMWLPSLTSGSVV